MIPSTESYAIIHKTVLCSPHISQKRHQNTTGIKISKPSQTPSNSLIHAHLTVLILMWICRATSRNQVTTIRSLRNIHARLSVQAREDIRTIIHPLPSSSGTQSWAFQSRVSASRRRHRRRRMQYWCFPRADRA